MLPKKKKIKPCVVTMYKDEGEQGSTSLFQRDAAHCDTAAANYNQDATEGNADADDCDFGPWGEISTTDCNMTVLIQNGASISVEGETVTEAWIGVTNSNGVVVGSVLWTNEVTSIAVWGEEGDIPGMAAGETLNFIVSLFFCNYRIKIIHSLI